MGIYEFENKMLPKLSFVIIANTAAIILVQERGSRRMKRTQNIFFISCAPVHKTGTRSCNIALLSQDLCLPKPGR